MCDSAFRWFIVLKKLKYFEVMLNIFELLQEWENVETWLVNFRKQCVIMMLAGEWGKGGVIANDVLNGKLSNFKDH